MIHDRYFADQDIPKTHSRGILIDGVVQNGQITMFGYALPTNIRTAASSFSSPVGISLDGGAFRCSVVESPNASFFAKREEPMKMLAIKCPFCTFRWSLNTKTIGNILEGDYRSKEMGTRLFTGYLNSKVLLDSPVWNQSKKVKGAASKTEDAFFEHSLDVDSRHFPLSVLKHFMIERDRQLSPKNVTGTDHPTDWNEFPMVAKVWMLRNLPKKQGDAAVAVAGAPI